MKKHTIFGIATVGMTLLSSFISKHEEVFKADASLSTLEWSVDKGTKTETGTVQLLSGEIRNDHGTLSASFTVDMNSIKSQKEELQNHLKGPDFFEVDKYSKATFVSTSITPLATPKDGLTHTVKGNLTIKDKTHENVFDIAVMPENGKLVCSGTVMIEKAKCEAVKNDIKIKFNVVTVKQ